MTAKVRTAQALEQPGPAAHRNASVLERAPVSGFVTRGLVQGPPNASLLARAIDPFSEHAARISNNGPPKLRVFDPARSSCEDIDTATLRLPAEIIEKLRDMAPAKRHPKLPYVFALALVTVAVAVGQNRSARVWSTDLWPPTSKVVPPEPALTGVSSAPSAPRVPTMPSPYPLPRHRPSPSRSMWRCRPPRKGGVATLREPRLLLAVEARTDPSHHCLACTQSHSGRHQCPFNGLG